MASRTATALQQTVRSVIKADPVATTDRDLLRHFLDRGDQSSFAALVARHSGMVLGVCRRVLPTVQDAEDACQAVFLVLAQKAGSIRWQSSLANWLYCTARKVAGNARVAAQRRAKREQRAAVPESLQPVDRMTGRELLTSLDAELEKLPPSYREPIVLSYLEGLTGDEVAARLGIPLATLHTRLARGRKKLHDALTKAGCALGAGLLALAVTSPAKASSPRLVQAILATVLGSVPETIAELAKGVAVNGSLNKSLIALVVFIALAGFGVGLGSLGPNAVGQQPKQVARDQEPAKPAADKPEAPAPKSTTYSGRVLGREGKPIAGAKVYLTLSWSNVHRLAPAAECAMTDTEGRFAFTSPKGMSGDQATVIAATAPDYGIGWVEVPPDGAKADLTVKMIEDDVPVTGQILDLQGKPIAGATLRVLQILAPKDSLDPWLDAVKEKKGQVHQREHQFFTQRFIVEEAKGLVPPVTTDREGRFRFTGLGGNRLLLVRLDGAEIASRQLRILTRKGEAIQVTEAEADPLAATPRVDLVYHPADFKHIAAPTTPVVGVVRDKDTNKPLAGFTIKSTKLAGNPLHGIEFLQATTDDQGRYRLTGLPRGEGSKIKIMPPADQPYLVSSIEVPAAENFEPVTVDVAMKRGVWIEGKITDKATGKPLQGSVHYLAAADNPQVREYPGYQGTFAQPNWNGNPDGTYRVVSIPGPGFVAVQCSDHYLLASERSDADGSKSMLLFTIPGVGAFSYNSIAKVDPPMDAEKVTRDVVLDPGLTITGTITDPDGQLLSGVRAMGLSGWRGWENAPLETAEFKVWAFNPARPRPILFRHDEKNLVGVFQVPKEAGPPVTIRLKPGATVTGRLVDPDGHALANKELDLSMRVSAGMTMDYFPSSTKIKTDKDGHFRINSLLPDRKFLLYNRQGQVRIGDGLRSGETMDLGNVPLKQPGD